MQKVTNLNPTAWTHVIQGFVKISNYVSNIAHTTMGQKLYPLTLTLLMH